MEVIRLCRLCLTFSEYHANIFFEKIKDRELWRLVNSVCELNTFLYDGLPEHICVDCEDTLKKTLSFRNQAIEANSALKLMIQRNKDLWEKFDASKSSNATPKVVETPEGTEAVVEPAVATPSSTRSTTVNKVSGVGSVADASPKKSKRLRSAGKNRQRKSNPLSCGRTRTVEVETPSCEDNKQGTSSEKDPTQQSLREHQSGADKEAVRPFVCQQCGASYVRKHFLQKHELAHRDESNCGQRLRSKRDLNSHMQIHVHPSSTKSSDLKNFPNLKSSEETARDSFESSSICSSRDNSFEISDTNKTINGKDLRVDVLQEEESAGPSKSIRNDTKSEPSHLKTPFSKSTFVCDICKKVFKYKKSLGKHVKIHYDEKPFVCDFCKKGFKWKSNLDRHVRVQNDKHSHLKASPCKRMFICDVCKTCFKSKHNLGRHVRIHYDERPFSCNVCDKTFKTNNGRYLHELRHMRDKMSVGKGRKKKQFSCKVCGKNFSHKNGLCRHFNTHSDKYKCNSCGKRFGSTVDLTRHSRIHTEEKPFKCEVCFKCFRLKCTLNGHLLSHSSDKPFSCDICDKRLKSKRDKTQHELYHILHK